MTDEAKPWRAEMPDVRSSRAKPQYDWCPVGQVRLLRDRCNTELDAAEARRFAEQSAFMSAMDMAEAELDKARARIAELEAAARREHVTTLEFIEEMEDTRKALHEEKNRTHSLALRIAELEAAEVANLRAIGEASGAMYEPDMGPTWPGSWAEQVSVIAGLRESQRHETDRFLRIEKLLGDNGCYCDCDCSSEEDHGEHCGERCFPCKVDAALRGVSL